MLRRVAWGRQESDISLRVRADSLPLHTGRGRLSRSDRGVAEHEAHSTHQTPSDPTLPLPRAHSSRPDMTRTRTHAHTSHLPQTTTAHYQTTPLLVPRTGSLLVMPLPRPDTLVRPYDGQTVHMAAGYSHVGTCSAANSTQSSMLHGTWEYVEHGVIVGPASTTRSAQTFSAGRAVSLPPQLPPTGLSEPGHARLVPDGRMIVLAAPVVPQCSNSGAGMRRGSFTAASVPPAVAIAQRRSAKSANASLEGIAAGTPGALHGQHAVSGKVGGGSVSADAVHAASEYVIWQGGQNSEIQPGKACHFNIHAIQ